MNFLVAPCPLIALIAGFLLLLDLVSILTKGGILPAALLYVHHMLRVRILRPDWDWGTPL